MTTVTSSPARRGRGCIETLPSGALRVKVYAGLDPITKQRHYLTETVDPTTPKAIKVAEQIRTRFLNELDEKRNARTNANVDQLVDKYLGEFNGAAKTKAQYKGLQKKHVTRPLGKVKVGNVDAAMLESLYADCRRCADHCDGRPYVQHRTSRRHKCDGRCGPHYCRPLSATTIRHIHYLLSGAYKRAIKWHWVSVNPVRQAEPPAAPKPNPQPPTSSQAAVIVNEAWKDPDWGTFLWISMTAGARRGEMCALRWSDLILDDPERAVICIQRAISTDEDGHWVEGETKTRQQRRVALDVEAALALIEHRAREQARAAALGLIVPDDAFVFSLDPIGSTFMLPGSVSQRYDRLVCRLGIKTTLHKLRHYSATELILAGVDARTVSGRLGHARVATTLDVYAAFVSEADQRAAGTLSARMPARPEPIDRADRAKENPQAPYEHIAATIRRRILNGETLPGQFTPSIHELASEFSVSFGTAQRSITLLRKWNMVKVQSGCRTVVLPLPEDSRGTVVTEGTVGETTGQVVDGADQRGFFNLEVVHLGQVLRTMRAEVNPEDGSQLRRFLSEAIVRLGHAEDRIGEYELNVCRIGEPEPMITFVATAA